jgi:phosphoglycolate phosphatase-like HAD superfamily hydrolase
MYDMTNPIKALILDFDNTLVLTNKFVHDHIIRTCLRTGIATPNGKEISAVLKENLKFEEIFVRLFGENGDKVLDEYRSDAKQHKFEAVHGGPEKMRELHNLGMKLIIVTNRVNLTLTRLEEAGYKKEWFTSVESTPEGHSKPDALAYENALVKLHDLGVEDSEIIVVGDAFGDYAAIPKTSEGKKRIAFLGVTSGSFTHDDWRRAGVHEALIAPTVAEMTLPNLHNPKGKVS